MCSWVRVNPRFDVSIGPKTELTTAIFHHPYSLWEWGKCKGAGGVRQKWGVGGERREKGGGVPAVIEYGLLILKRIRIEMNLIYVTSDTPGAGKTVTAMALALNLQQRGLKVAYFKPLGADPDSDSDVNFAKAMGVGVVEPLSLGAGAVGEATPGAVVEQARDALAEAGEWDAIVVEGISLSTGDDNSTEISQGLARGLEAKVVAILDYRAGSYNDDLSRISEAFGESLVGVFVNRAIRHRTHEVREMLKAGGGVDVKVLGVIPEDRLMVSVSLNQVAEALEGSWVWGEEQGANLVERYLIGGNLMDSGDSYFNQVDSKAVIVRGDRPDIQLSALTGPVVGMINTGGHKPVEYLLHEVEQLDVPLMVTPHRTAEAVEALAGALEGAHPYHREKVSRFLELLRTHCGIDEMLRAD